MSNSEYTRERYQFLKSHGICVNCGNENACIGLPYLDSIEDRDVVMMNHKGKPLTSRGVSERLQEFAKKYDIPKEVMHPHSFRHFFAMEFLKRNNNISFLADLLGHGSVNITQIYLRQSQEEQKSAIDKAVDW